MMHIQVLTDRIKIGAVEFVPRFLDLPRVLVVNAGETITPLGDSTWDYIEVAGTLSISRDFDTVLRFMHLVILPGGHLDCGSEDHPMPRHVEFIVRDVPIDLTRDPFQWGNGLLNFGKQDRCGLPKTAWTEATDALQKDSKIINLRSVPDGWAVGDTLLLPDMVTPDYHTHEPQRESPVTIAAINGTQIILSKPLDFAHPNVVDPQGVVIQRPYVANLTRNIVIRSENPNGTPGHTADVGMMPMWCVCYNESHGLGRTTIDPLDDAANGIAGKNQRGRYAEHHHHVGSSPESMDVGNVYVGRGGLIGAKWGLAHHNTSDTHIERNIVIDFPGAGFVTEDGYEVRNVYRQNLSAYNLGHAVDEGGVFFDAAQNVRRNAPGSEGTGFWIRGIINVLDGNVSINNFNGFNLFNQGQPDGLYPSVPGAEPDTALKQETDLPISFANNVAVANYANGLEIWSVTKFPYRNLMIAHTTLRNIFVVSSNVPALYMQHPIIIGEAGKGSDGIHSSMGYVQTFDMEGGQIAGCAIGIQGGGGGMGMNITGAVLQNEVNIDMTSIHLLMKDVIHKPLANVPPRYVLLDDGPIWHEPDPLPKVGISMWLRQRGSDLIVKNWQGTGKDFQLFSRRSLASNPAWYSAPQGHEYNTPVKGLTMQESWDTYGLSYGGDVLKESDAIELEGIVGGLARPGLTTVLGPPRAIVTYPTLRAPALREGDVVRIAALLTGDPTLASDVMALSVDGDAPYFHQKDGTDDRGFTTAHIEPGVHTIEVWRTKKDEPLEELLGTRYRSQYFLGDAPPPPVDPPPPTTATVPNVVGRTHASAVSAITAVRLLPTVTMQHHATVPAGHILSQAPSAGAVVALGSSVNLIESDGPMPTLPPPAEETWTATTITAEKSSKGRVRILIG